MTVVSLSDRQEMIAIESLKSYFPIFVDNELTTNLAYLDNAATTHKPSPVLDAIKRATEEFHAPVHRGFYNLGEMSSDAYESARETIRNFIGAQSSRSVIFTTSATDSINQVADIYLSNTIKAGQTIWVSRMEHHANFLPWQALAQRANATLKIIELTKDGELDLSRHPELFSEQSALIAVTHTSNVLGVQNNIQSICKQSKAFNIPVLVDAAQAMVSNHINVAELDCDFLVFSGHKMFGPNGIGVLYISPSRLADCQPSRLGGGMIDFIGETFSDNVWSEAPLCFEAGSPNLPGAVGLAAACDFIDSIGQDNIKRHLSSLSSALYDDLLSFPGVQIVTPPDHLSSGIISFFHKDIHAHDLAQILGDNHVAVRAGHHCAQPLLDYLQTSSTLRVSVTLYNSTADVQQLINALRAAEELFC